MIYLTNSAAYSYLETCRTSFLLGLIGHHVFLARLDALHAMCPPGHPARRFAEQALIAEQWGEGRLWEDGPESGPISSELERENGSSEVEWSDEEDDDDAPTILRLVPSASTGLGTWEFHKGDADPFPSVPHAHGRSDDRRKLDAYLGFIYFKSAQDGREPRSAIVKLWNDLDFRVFAEEAIEHFICHHPSWSWRVVDPLRLPRVRR